MDIVKTSLIIILLIVVGLFIFSLNDFIGFKTKQVTPISKVATGNDITKSGDSFESRYAILSSEHTNFCAKADFIASKSDDERLQGSCCSKMDFHRYTEQVEGLKKYPNTNQIPSDPYDIPVSLAKELLWYKKTIKLTSEQQAIYDEAMQMSHEHGPCCCKCWRWDAFEGLAKYLITEHSFNAQQIAEIWNLADGCGGKGHIDAMHT